MTVLLNLSCPAVATVLVAACAQSTRGAAAFRTNLGNETAVRKLVPTVVEHMGHLDAVVHCASTFEHDTEMGCVETEGERGCHQRSADAGEQRRARPATASGRHFHEGTHGLLTPVHVRAPRA